MQVRYSPLGNNLQKYKRELGRNTALTHRCCWFNAECKMIRQRLNMHEIKLPRFLHCNTNCLTIHQLKTILALPCIYFTFTWSLCRIVEEQSSASVTSCSPPLTSLPCLPIHFGWWWWWWLWWRGKHEEILNQYWGMRMALMIILENIDPREPRGFIRRLCFVPIL